MVDPIAVCKFSWDLDLPNYILIPWIFGLIILYILGGWLTYKWAKKLDIDVNMGSSDGVVFLIILWPIGMIILLIITLIQIIVYPILLKTQLDLITSDVNKIKKKLKIKNGSNSI